MKNTATFLRMYMRSAKKMTFFQNYYAIKKFVDVKHLIFTSVNYFLNFGNVFGS